MKIHLDYSLRAGEDNENKYVSHRLNVNVDKVSLLNL